MVATSTGVEWTAVASAAANRTHTDEALIRRIAQHDKTAMRQLFGRYQVRLYRFILRLLRDEALAEDVVNEVFLHVWGNAERFEGRSTVSTWLFAIARNSTITALRQRKDVNLDAAIAPPVWQSVDDPEAILDRADKSKMIRTCLNRLSGKHAQILDLVYYHERSVGEVAEILSIPQATVKTRMFYARKKLAELIKSERAPA
jgi:RNA polymerase sigma-70 factor, ECF subfamily